MRKERVLFILGVWVAILPYLGFPYAWKSVLFVLTGLGLIYFSYVLYGEAKAGETKEKKKTVESFSENKEFAEEKKVQ